jgi:hypothetical protein
MNGNCSGQVLNSCQEFSWKLSSSENDNRNLTTGYMLSFNFNKKKEQGVHLVHIGDKLLYEGTL